MERHVALFLLVRYARAVATLASNDDPRIGHAIFDQRKKLGGILRMQTDAPVRRRAAETRD